MFCTRAHFLWPIFMFPVCGITFLSPLTLWSHIVTKTLDTFPCTTSYLIHSSALLILKSCTHGHPLSVTHYNIPFLQSWLSWEQMEPVGSSWVCCRGLWCADSSSAASCTRGSSSPACQTWRLDSPWRGSWSEGTEQASSCFPGEWHGNIKSTNKDPHYTIHTYYCYYNCWDFKEWTKKITLHVLAINTREAQYNRCYRPRIFGQSFADVGR